MSKVRSVIVAAKRTPIGSFQGSLSSKSVIELGSHALNGAIEKSGLQKNQIEELFCGCVLTGGVGQAPARQGK
jgi:acetyl-CoA C-acetyltransferase